MDPDREWWLRVPAVFLSPRSVFVALRNETREEVEARSEPVLAIVAFAGYFIVGGALYLGARGLGSEGSFRRSRHVLGFAVAPLALSLFLLWPVQLAVFGTDLFRRYGDDEGDAGRVFDVLELGFAAWSAALLLVGVRAVHGWSWWRSLAALGLVALFLAAFAYLPTVL